MAFKEEQVVEEKKIEEEKKSEEAEGENWIAATHLSTLCSPIFLLRHIPTNKGKMY